MIRYEDLVRAAARFLTQVADVQLDERGQAVNWDTRTPSEVAEALRSLADRVGEGP
jgi:hypothetical protein